VIRFSGSRPFNLLAQRQRLSWRLSWMTMDVFLDYVNWHVYCRNELSRMITFEAWVRLVAVRSNDRMSSGCAVCES